MVSIIWESLSDLQIQDQNPIEQHSSKSQEQKQMPVVPAPWEDVAGPACSRPGLHSKELVSKLSSRKRIDWNWSEAQHFP